MKVASQTRGILDEMRAQAELSKYKSDVYELYRAENIRDKTYDTTSIQNLRFGDLKSLLPKPNQESSKLPTPQPAQNILPQAPQIPAPVETLRDKIIRYTDLPADLISKNQSSLKGNITEQGNMMYRGHKIVWDPDGTRVKIKDNEYPATVGLMILLMYNGNQKTAEQAINNHWGKITEEDIKNFLEISRFTAVKIRDVADIPKENALMPIYTKLSDPQRKAFAAYMIQTGTGKTKKIAYYNPVRQIVQIGDNIGAGVSVGSKFNLLEPMNNQYARARFNLLIASVNAGNDSPLVQRELEELRQQL